MTSSTSTKGLRIAGISAASAALLLIGSSTAWAHDCFNANRSAAGNAAAGSNSQAWFNLVISDAIAEEVADELYTAEQGECVLEYWSTHGGPESVAFKVKGANGTDGVLISKNPNEAHFSDGRGIDLFEDALVPLIFESYEACGVELELEEH